jgi:hypothetical protein
MSVTLKVLDGQVFHDGRFVCYASVLEAYSTSPISDGLYKTLNMRNHCINDQWAKYHALILEGVIHDSAQHT